MRLTQFSDYSLRILLYLAANGGRPVAIAEIAKVYQISHHHLVKAVMGLVKLDLVRSVRGRRGGYYLAVAAEEINVGWVVRRTEPDFNLVECFDPETDTCPITGVCGLQGILIEAKDTFFATLDRYTVADLLGPRERELQLVQLWSAGAATSSSDSDDDDDDPDAEVEADHLPATSVAGSKVRSAKMPKASAVRTIV